MLGEIMTLDKYDVVRMKQNKNWIFLYAFEDMTLKRCDTNQKQSDTCKAGFTCMGCSPGTKTRGVPII